MSVVLVPSVPAAFPCELPAITARAPADSSTPAAAATNTDRSMRDPPGVRSSFPLNRRDDPPLPGRDGRPYCRVERLLCVSAGAPRTAVIDLLRASLMRSGCVTLRHGTDRIAVGILVALGRFGRLVGVLLSLSCRLVCYGVRLG